MNTAWQQREEAKRSLRADPNNGILRKAVKMAGKNLEKVRKAAVLNFFWATSANSKHAFRKATTPALSTY